MTVKRLLLLLKRDIFMGVIRNWRYYGTAALFFSVIAVFFAFKANKFMTHNNILDGLSMVDFLTNIFVGIEPLERDRQGDGAFPFTWIIFHSYLAFIVGFYVSDDLKGDTGVLIMRAHARSLWWISKFTWCTLSVLLYYLLCLLTAALVSLPYGSPFSDGNHAVMRAFWNLNIASCELTMVLTISLFVSISISALQVVLSLIIKPIFVFMGLIGYLVISLFSDNSMLLYGLSMISRAKNFDLARALMGPSMLLSFAILLFSCLLGLKIMQRKDIV